MFTKTLIATALVLGSVSASFATGEYDPNLANRYPAFAAPAAAQTQVLQSAPVSLQQGGGAQILINNDRESLPRAGGVG
jgi:hypothetical protein